MKYKNFIKKIFATLICFCILFLSAVPSVMVSRYYTDDSIKYAQARFQWFYEQEDNSLDVIYVGSSAIYRYDINVQNFNDYGFTSANLCTPAQPFAATKYLIEEALKTQNPKLFVIEIRQFVRTAAAAATCSEIYKSNRFETYYSSLFSSLNYSLTRSKMIHSVIDDPKEAISWDMEFIRHHNTWRSFSSIFDMVERVTDTSYFDKLKDINVISVVDRNKKIKFLDYKSIKDKIQPPEEYMEVFDDLLDYIKEKNLNVLFLSTPYQATKSHRSVQNYMAEYIKSRGYEYIDQHEQIKEMGIDPERDYSDNYHVDLFGAEKWTKFTGKMLSKRIGQCKHYSSVNKQWDKAFENWSEIRPKKANTLSSKIK